VGILPDFHSREQRFCGHPSFCFQEIRQKILARQGKCKSGGARPAQDMLHTAVDGLHSIDFSADKTPPFLLTLKLEGVKTTSFFDSF
jgi:hypothetical protein